MNFLKKIFEFVVDYFKKLFILVKKIFGFKREVPPPTPEQIKIRQEILDNLAKKK
jgi:hypothetical protein